MANADNKPEQRSIKSNLCQERQIKVTRSLYEYKPKTNDDSPTYHRVQHVPWIQLKGKWLQQAGFEIDMPIKVRVMKGCIVLTTESLAVLESPYEIV